MPNWIENSLNISCKTKEDAERIFQQITKPTESGERELDFEKIIPMSDELNVERTEDGRIISSTSIERGLIYLYSVTDDEKEKTAINNAYRSRNMFYKNIWESHTGLVGDNEVKITIAESEDFKKEVSERMKEIENAMHKFAEYVKNDKKDKENADNYGWHNFWLDKQKLDALSRSAERDIANADALIEDVKKANRENKKNEENPYQKWAEYEDIARKAVQNYEKYAATDWYEWRINNWGTKTHAVDCEVSLDDTEIIAHFSTAWSHPAPIVHKLATMPDVVNVREWYCDEDIFGGNCGEYEKNNQGVITYQDFPDPGIESLWFYCDRDIYALIDIADIYTITEEDIKHLLKENQISEENAETLRKTLAESVIREAVYDAFDVHGKLTDTNVEAFWPILMSKRKEVAERLIKENRPPTKEEKEEIEKWVNEEKQKYPLELPDNHSQTM